MAKNQQNPSTTNPSTFIKGMIKDVDDSFYPKGGWYHARNLVNHSKDGNEGTISNEPSNTFCANAPYPIIGAIHLNADRWVIYSTNNTDSEIGLFSDDACTYSRIAVDFGNSCLNFNLNYIIIGVSKENFDCTFQVYWADSNNPDRTLTVERPAFLQNCRDENNTLLPGPPNYITVGCITCTDRLDPIHGTPLIDCDKIRLAPLVKLPCVTVSQGPSGGSILNGSYYAVIAYVLNSQRVTDYFTPSNTQALFDHDNAASSLLITIDQMDTTHFDYFELVIVRTVNSQTSAKKIGVYSTRQSQISLDTINEALESVPVEFIPLRTPNYEKSDGIYEVGDYMLRVGPRSRFDFNYQPLANRIITKWQAVAYPSDYYVKGGNATGYMRDEVYPFFVRWVFDTGDRTASYHIPGRPSLPSDLVSPAFNILPDDPNNVKLWAAQSTASITAGGINNPGIAPALPDGGIPIAEGNMGYWESSEKYPDKKADIFNASAHPWSTIPIPPYAGTLIDQYDLCGEVIRHHKFPENKLIPHFRVDPSNVNNRQIIVMAVDFDNILPPVDNNGVLIPGIVGYEILRGSREGNRTIIAKGITNFMRSYALQDPTKVGLYANYPYNYLGVDPTLVSKENEGEYSPINDVPNLLQPGPVPGVFPSNISTSQFTFHSPDTSFNNPFLSSRELKLYGEMSGAVTGRFDEQPGHPKEKLISDIAFLAAAFVGIGSTIIAMNGRSNTNFVRPPINRDAHGIQPTTGGTGIGVWGINDLVGLGAILTAQGILSASYLPSDVAYDAAKNTGANILTLLFTGNDVPLNLYRDAITATGTANSSTKVDTKEEIVEQNSVTAMPLFMRVAGAVPIFTHYYNLGTNTALDLIIAIVPYTQYALRYTSHGFMDRPFQPIVGSTYRYQLNNAIYLKDGMQNFGENANAVINNTYRSKTVALQIDATNGFVPTAFNSGIDNTVRTVNTSTQQRQANPNYNFSKTPHSIKNVKLDFNTFTVSHYASLKNRLRNQYGQIDSIIQIPASYCEILTPNLVAGTAVPPSGIIFNGDIYIGRYTEKNTFFYFWDWLYDQPDGYEFNYAMRYMLNYPRYWADFTRFDAGEFLNNFLGSILSLSWAGLKDSFPSGRHRLDGPLVGWPINIGSVLQSLLRVTERYFYTFQSGVRDFFVESEVNIDLRDWEEPISKRHYDPYRLTDERTLFDIPDIKSGNFFKYDQSLSISRLYNNFFSWGNVQDRDYDPFTAATCYVYYKKRVIYSLPQNLEAKKDFWRVFLANNYKDFRSRVTAVSPINKNGSMFFFYEQAPIMYQGVDTLQTELGTKITIGDGGLFKQPEQSVVNADESYEYASCQNRLSVANTPVGLYWIGQNQGKIFKYGGSGVQELSAINMKFWFSRFLPYQLIIDFPNYDVIDNPVGGIGCTTIYNNRDNHLYFAKKDFVLRSQFAGLIIYNPLTSPNPGFFLGNLQITLGDPQYFEDASWTISFDPKSNSWQSFHDWIPDLMLPSKSFHLTTFKNPLTNVGELWKHTDNQTSFCNFYGVDYPFEFDYISQTGQSVDILRSIEYFMEAHIYRNNKTDFFHVLDWNFDHAIIYNSEQVSGMLILNDTPKNDVAGRLLYPIINPTSIDILFDKVEQKYRFNQFWDITADRGEYTFPNVQRQIWQTEPNGYIRNLNPANLNYNKLEFQRKKFRHYANHLLLRKNISANVKILMKLSNNKDLISFR